MVERSNAMKHETVKKEKNVKGEMEHRKNMEDVGLEDIQKPRSFFDRLGAEYAQLTV